LAVKKSNLERRGGVDISYSGRDWFLFKFVRISYHSASLAFFKSGRITHQDYLDKEKKHLTR